MRFSPFIIDLLREKSGYEIRLSHDCDLLTLDIESMTGEHIGVNTMKRLLGFIADERTPRTSTLNIIARYRGSHYDWKMQHTAILFSTIVTSCWLVLWREVRNF